MTETKCFTLVDAGTNLCLCSYMTPVIDLCVDGNGSCTQQQYNEKDFEESKLWDIYRQMYEDCFEHCNEVPWIIVPADQNWYKEWIIAKTVRDALKEMDMQYPGIKKN